MTKGVNFIMSVAKMKDGKRWYVFIRYKDWDGTTRQHKKEGFTRRADAQQYERDFLDRKSGSTSMTFNSMYKLYMEDCETRLKPTTFYNKQAMFQKHVLPQLGNLNIDEITPSVIRKWQNSLIGDTYSPTYLKTVNNQVSALFNYAVKYYGLKNNPARIAGSMGKKNADSMQFWTTDEFEQFQKAIMDKPVSWVAFNVLYWTGMRQGELFALTRADVDLDNNTIRINKSYARLGKEDIIQEPKTPKSKRVIVIPQFLADILRDYINGLYALNPDDRLFPHTKHFLVHEMKRGCKLSGVNKIRIHDLRHSHASMLIEMGYSPILIAERLGHENIETTLQTYSHLYPNKQEELASAMDKLKKCYDSATQENS